MMLLGDTIAVAKTVVAGQRDVISKCTDLCLRLHRRGSGQCNCDTASTLTMLKADIQHHLEAVTVLARTGSKVTQLVRVSEFCV
jgi:hypothetical protein